MKREILCMAWKTISAGAILSAALLLVPPTALGATDESQRLLLNRVLRAEPSDWSAVLVDHREQLDDEFLQRVQDRILLSLQNNQVDDAIRFAVVGDLASETMGRTGDFRATLVEAFEKAGNAEAARLARQSLR